MLVISSLRAASYVSGESIHGVLGCDFLNDYVVSIDSDRQKITFSTNPHDGSGQCAPFKRDRNGLPAITIGAEGLGLEKLADAEFLIDTGAIGHPLEFGKGLFQLLIDTGRLRVDSKISVVDFFGPTEERRGVLDRFRLWRDAGEITVLESTRYDTNIIGLSYLLQFNVVFDFPNSTLYLLPRKTPPPRVVKGYFSGLGVSREGTEIVVTLVDPQCPASRAGIREGDIIMSVDGVAAQKLRLFSLRASLKEEGKTVRLGMLRNSKAWTVDLALKEWRKPVTEADFE